MDRKKIKVGMLVPSLCFKGPVIVALNISRYCKEKNIEFVFVSLRNNSDNNKLIFHDHNIKVIELGMPKVPTPYFIRQYRKTIKENNFDIIHAHSFWPTVISAFIQTDLKRIVTIHNNPREDFTYEYGALMGRFMESVFRKSLREFDCCVAISDYINDVLKVAKSKVIYNGVEDSQDRVKLDKKLMNFFECPSETVFLASISVLNRRKDVGRILDIVNQCNKRNFIVKCIIVGEGNQKKQLERYVLDNHLNDKIFFTGTKSHEEIYSIISMVDALILTSKSEGFGLVVAEAFMCSKLVIVNDIPVMKELIDHKVNGYILQTNQEFIEIIHDLKTIDSFTMNSQARIKYESHFNVDIMCAQYAEMYYDQIGGM